MEAKAAQTRDAIEAERAEVNRVQEQQSLVEARRNIESARREAQQAVEDAEAAFRENPTMENAEARVAAIDRVNELAKAPDDIDVGSPIPEQPRLALPAPEGRTASIEDGAKMLPEEPHAYTPQEQTIEASAKPADPNAPAAPGVAAAPAAPVGETVINANGTPESIARMKARLQAETEPAVYVVNGERVETEGYRRANQSAPVEAAPGQAVADATDANPSRSPLPGPYGDATPNEAWAGVKRPAGGAEAATDPATPATPQTPEQQAAVKGVEAIGDSARNEEGELPRRVYGTNLRTLTSGDEAKKSFITGAMLLDEDEILLKREIEEGIFERAAKVTKWDNPNVVRSAKADGSYSAAEGLALMDKTAGALETAYNDLSPANLKQLQELSAANGRVGTAQARALGARNLMSEARTSNMTPLEIAVFNTQKMWSSKDKHEIPSDVLESLLKIGDPNDRKAITKVLKSISIKHAGFMGQADSFRYANMLSSPMTQALNTISNTTKMFMFPVVHAGARAADAVAPGGRQLATGETRVAMKGAYAGLFDAGRNFRMALSEGFTMRDMDALDPGTMNVEMRGGAKNPMNYPSRLLHATDEFFKTINESAARSMHAHRKAYFEGQKKGLKGNDLDKYIQDTVPAYYNDRAVQKAAKDFATRAVWQEGAPISIPALRNLPDSVAGPLNYTMRVVIPFTRVIGNVTKEGITYAGGGLFAPLDSVSSKITGMKPMTREAKTEAFTKAVMGVSAGIALTSYAADGNITTDAPRDARERELFYESGKKPFSIRIGDRWVDYRMLGPLAWPIMGAARYAEDAKERPDAGTMGHLTQAALGVVQTTAQLPVLSGMGGLLELISNPTERGLQMFGSNIASQLVPMSSAQRFVNNIGATGGTVPEAAAVGERVKAGTVLQGGSDVLGVDPLPRKVNSFGEEVTRNGYFPEVEGGDTLYKEMDRLGLKPPSMPSTMKVERGNPTRKLTQAEKRIMLKARTADKDYLTSYISNPRYQGLSDEKKKYWLEKNMSDRIKKATSRGKRQVKQAARP